MTEQQIQTKAERKLARLITALTAMPPEGLTREDVEGIFSRNREGILKLIVAKFTRAAKKAERKASVASAPPHQPHPAAAPAAPSAPHEVVDDPASMVFLTNSFPTDYSEEIVQGIDIPTLHAANADADIHMLGDLSLRAGDLAPILRHFLDIASIQVIPAGSCDVLFRRSSVPGHVEISLAPYGFDRESMTTTVKAEGNPGAMAWWSLGTGWIPAILSLDADVRVELKEKFGLDEKTQKQTRHVSIFFDDKLHATYPASSDVAIMSLGHAKGGYVGIDAAVLADMLRVTIPCISTDEARISFTGLSFTISPSRLRCVATDGHRLGGANAHLIMPHNAAMTIANWGMGDDGVHILIPRALVETVSKEIAKRKWAKIGQGRVGFRLYGFRTGRNINHQPESEIMAEFAIGDYRYVMRTITGRFPNLEQVIPGEMTCWSVVSDRKGFIDALGRAKKLVTNKGGGYAWIWGTPAKAAITLFPHAQKDPAASKSVHLKINLAKVVGPSSKIGGVFVTNANPTYLLDAVKALDSLKLVPEGDLFIGSPYCNVEIVDSKAENAGPNVFTLNALRDPKQAKKIPYRAFMIVMGMHEDKSIPRVVDELQDEDIVEWDFEAEVQAKPLLRALSTARDLLGSGGKEPDKIPRVVIFPKGHDKVFVAALPLATNRLTETESAMVASVEATSVSTRPFAALTGGRAGVVVSLQEALVMVRDAKSKTVTIRGGVGGGEYYRRYLFEVSPEKGKDAVSTTWDAGSSADHVVCVRMAEDLWDAVQQNGRECIVPASQTAATLERLAIVASVAEHSNLKDVWLSGQRVGGEAAFWGASSDGHRMAVGRLRWPQGCDTVQPELAAMNPEPIAPAGASPYYYGGFGVRDARATITALDGADDSSVRALTIHIKAPATLVEIIKMFSVPDQWASIPKHQVRMYYSAQRRMDTLKRVIVGAGIANPHGATKWLDYRGFATDEEKRELPLLPDIDAWLKAVVLRKTPSMDTFKREGIHTPEQALKMLEAAQLMTKEEIAAIESRYPPLNALIFEATTRKNGNADIVVFAALSSDTPNPALVETIHDSTRDGGGLYLRDYWQNNGDGPITLASVSARVKSMEDTWAFMVDADIVLAAIKKGLSSMSAAKATSPLFPQIDIGKDGLNVVLSLGDQLTTQSIAVNIQDLTTGVRTGARARTRINARYLQQMMDTRKGGNLVFVVQASRDPATNDHPVRVFHLIDGQTDVGNLIMPMQF